MAFYSSVSLKYFLDDTFGPLPPDAYPLTPEEHQAYMTGQLAGKIIDFSTEPPSLIDPPPPSFEELATAERAWRDGELVATDGVITRHRDERDMGRPTTLTDERFTGLLSYRQALRNWPQGGEFPQVDHRPIAPPWLAEQTL
ncbi:phage tail assembly chaperone [Pseudomonas sp. A-B-19]|uniref:phage tail assembly chaperone n=1 Tax=Pseudomonas sp. A-B-19 TaxID=2832405 RepID=UPI001CBC9BE2|nr:phage tail assembly chaperone [Pseudomonas sp. A-B-19]